MGFEFDLNVKKKDSFDYNKVYDLAIIGGGPGGLSAALYAKRKGINVVLISGDIGGQVADTSSVENYLGIESMTGEEMVKTFRKHVESYDVPMLDGTKVNEVKQGKEKILKLDNGKEVKTKTVIIGTGSLNRKLNVPGEEEFNGKGVTYCAICDGPLFEDMDVLVAGGGNSAVEAAIDLSKTASSVKLVQRSVLRADEVLIDRMNSLENVEVYLGYQIKEIKGENSVSAVITKNKETGEEVTFETRGVFVEIGYTPNTKFVENLVELNDSKEIVINDRNETSEKGIFAIGDATIVPYKQIIIAASEGAKAALSAVDYLNKN
ncbi:MAG TPA: FAD-dependent oxidoreductase [Clostridia bacterium]|nr:FAD-dependent oxidoreductase [Clostridia bacterium]